MGFRGRSQLLNIRVTGYGRGSGFCVPSIMSDATRFVSFFGTPVEHPERGPGSTRQADFTDGADFVFVVLRVAGGHP